MTNEVILNRLMVLKKRLSVDEQLAIDTAINKNVKLVDLEDTASVLANLILDVKADMEMDYAKKNGVGEKLKSARRILKGAKGRPTLEYAYTEESGIQNICNGFCLVRLTEPLTLPELPAGETYLDVNKVIPKQINPITLNLPSLSELKSYYKLKKAEKMKTVYYDFGENLPLVDAEMLIDIMTLVPNAVAKWEKYAIVFVNDNGDYALQMTIHKRGV